MYVWALIHISTSMYRCTCIIYLHVCTDLHVRDLESWMKIVTYLYVHFLPIVRSGILLFPSRCIASCCVDYNIS